MIKIILIRICSWVGVWSLFVCGAQAETRSMVDRLEQLERNQEEMFKQVMEKNNPVKAFLNEEVLFGGFLDSGLTGIWGPDTKTQASANAHWFGLSIAAKFNDQWRFNSQVLTSVGFTLSNPNNYGSPLAVSFLGVPQSREFGSASISLLLAQGYAEYVGTPWMNVQMGLGYMPFGIAPQQRELVLFRRRGGPQLLTGNGDDGVVFLNPLWMGFHLNGTFNVLQKRMGYNVYTFSSTPYSKALGLGARAWFQPLDSLVVGTSMQDGKRNRDSSYTTYGADAKLTFQRWGVTMEYARQAVKNEDPWTVYVEPEVSFFDGALLVYGAFDYLNNTVGVANNGARRLSDPYELMKYGGGINWLPTSYTRYRIGLLKNDYVGQNAISGTQDRDYWSLDVSVGVAF